MTVTCDHNYVCLESLISPKSRRTRVSNVCDAESEEWICLLIITVVVVLCLHCLQNVKNNITTNCVSIDVFVEIINHSIDRQYQHKHTSHQRFRWVMAKVGWRHKWLISRCFGQMMAKSGKCFDGMDVLSSGEHWVNCCYCLTTNVIKYADEDNVNTACVCGLIAELRHFDELSSIRWLSYSSIVSSDHSSDNLLWCHTWWQSVTNH